jgi:AcrR family transcriptional regulator
VPGRPRISSQSKIVDAQAEAPRERIIDAAANLFRDKGYAAVSLREIAGAAGVTTGSVYYRFASKDDAVLAVMNSAHELILNEVSNAVELLGDQATERDKLSAAIAAHVSTLFGQDSRPAATIRIFHQVPRTVSSATLTVRHAYESYWISLLEDCKSAGLIGPGRSTNVLVPLIFGSMNWLLEWFDPRAQNLDVVKSEIFRLLVPSEEPMSF